jgi:DNA-nicking Smr family endonuclease
LLITEPKEMNIGDRVRLLHGKEEGIVSKILPGGEVEIEIEEGFRIPALKSEVVVISEVEDSYFKKEKAQPTSNLGKSADRIPADSEAGLFLAYIPYNDQNHGVYLVNNRKKDFLFSVSEIHGDSSKTLAAGVAKANSPNRVDEKSIKDFENWPTLLILLIPINSRIEKTEKPFERRVKFKASAFFKSKGKSPILNKDGYVFRLDQTMSDLDVHQLNRDLNPTDSGEKPIGRQFTRPEKEIDLHIEKLTTAHEFLSNTEKLRLQMETFEKNLNYAIATGMDEITFIHGIGNGVLRKEIHRHLSQLTHISYFKDTHKSNFGYGATLVRIHE